MSTTSKDLFLAILTMDSYNRGYQAKFEGLSEAKNIQIGDAFIITNSSLELGQGAISSSFYALAYSYDGGTVISYRGTDAAMDAATGWLQGAGHFTSQGIAAAQFYKEVIGNASPYDVNVTFVGHSLGGGLAGLMASLYNKDAYLFDYMPFQSSAHTILDEVLINPVLDEIYYFNGAVVSSPKFDKINAYSVTGEMLAFLRYTDTIIEKEYASHGGLRSPIDLHSQALLVNLMYADKNGYTDWQGAGSAFIDALFNDEVSWAFNGVSADVMLTKIAYTAIESGGTAGQPFGNAAIHAMFNDANDLGKLYQPANAEFLLNIWKVPLANILVQYAGQLAENKVAVGEGNQAILDGVLKVSENTELLTIDLSDQTWTFGETPTHQNIIGRNQLIDVAFQTAATESGLGVYTYLKDLVSEIWEGFSYNDVDQLAIVTRNYGVDVSVGNAASGNYTFILGGTGSDKIIGSNGKNFIFAGTGSDTLTGGSEQDIIFGGRDDNTIYGGGGNDFMFGGYGNDYLDGGLGDDTIVAGAGDVIAAGEAGDRLYLNVFDAENPSKSLLVGGTREGWASHPDRVQYSDEPYTGRFGETYEMEGNDLIITIPGSENPITIKNFEDGDYGIRLKNYINAMPQAFEYEFTNPTTTAEQIGENFKFMQAAAAFDPWENFRVQGGGVMHGWIEGEDSPFGENGDEEPAPPAPQEGTSGDDSMEGSAGNDNIAAGGGNDVLEGGKGDDTLNGGSGSDIYVFKLGDGHDVIVDAPSSSYFFVPHVNTLKLGAGISADNVSVSRGMVQTLGLAEASDDLVLSINGGQDSITLKGYFTNNADISRVEFEDGSVWLKEDLITRLVADAGTAGNDSIVATDYDDFIEGKAGDDLLIGEGGNDTYYYRNGDGNDIIRKSGSGLGGAEQNRIVFADDITPQDVVFERDMAQPYDLLIHISSTGDVIRVVNQFVGNLRNIDHIAFEADGTVWDFAYIEQQVAGHATSGDDSIIGFASDDLLQGSAGNDVLAELGSYKSHDTLIGGVGDDTLMGGYGGDRYVFNRGDGKDVISDSGEMAEHASLEDYLQFGTTISIADITAQHDGIFVPGTQNQADLKLTIAGGSDEILIESFASHAGFIEKLDFAEDGVIDGMTLWYLADQEGMGLNKITGNNTAQTLTGTAGSDHIRGYNGNDTINGGAGRDFLFGEQGNDVLNGGNNGDFLFGGAGNDVLNGDEGDDALYAGIGNDTLSGGTGNDGLWGAEGNDTLNGGAGNDTLYGGAGNDSLTGGAGTDFLFGGAGNNTYYYNSGDGVDFVIAGEGKHAGDSNTLRLGSGLTFENVDIYYDKEGYASPFADAFYSYYSPSEALNGLVIASRTNPQDKVFIQDFLGKGGVDTLVFGDGTEWSRGDILAHLFGASAGDETATVHYGIDASGIAYGGKGNDVLQDADHYIFAAGDGQDTISDEVIPAISYIYGDDTLYLAGGITAEQVVVERNGYSMVLHLSGTDKIFVNDQFFIQASGLEFIHFDDGTIWDDSDIVAHALVSATTTGNDELIGADYSDDILQGGAGNDTLKGGGGKDTYIYNAGDGNDTIIDAPVNQWGNSAEKLGDILHFGEGIGKGDLSFSRAGQNDVLITVAGGGSVLIKEQLTGTGQGIELITFSNGMTLDDSQIKEALLAAEATAGADTLTGFVQADSIRGGAGNDVLDGKNGGDTYYFAANDGQDIIQDSGTEGTDRIRFDEDISPVQTSFGRTGSGGSDLIIHYGNGNSVTVKGQFTGHGIEEIIFHDGTVLKAKEIEAKVVAAQASSGHDVITGFAGADTLAGGVGNDTLDGGNGADTYVFHRGDGQDTIQDNGEETAADTIVFGEDIVPADLYVQASGQDLFIGFREGEDSILVKNQLVDGAIGNIVFADGTVWDATRIAQAMTNTAPVAVAVDDVAVQQGEPFYLNAALLFTDAEGDILTYTVTQADGSPLPSWLTFANGVLSGVPANGDIGELALIIRATDSFGISADMAFTVEVNNVNDAPQVAVALQTQNLALNTAFTYQLPQGLFMDPDVDDQNEDITYTATLQDGSALPSWLTFDAQTRTFSGTPVTGGPLAVAIHATDVHGATGTVYMGLVIGAANSAPVVAHPIASQTATEDQPFHFALPENIFSDADVQDRLTFSATLQDGSPLPSWLLFEDGVFSGLPDNGDVGQLQVKVTAQDLAGATTIATFILNVANVNDAPEVQATIPSWLILEDHAFTLEIPENIFADVDVGDSLTITATQANGLPLPSWVTFDGETFTMNPNDSAVGPHTFAVHATDSHGAQVSTEFTLIVAPVNDAPTVNTAISDIAVDAGEAFTYIIPLHTFKDVDSLSLDYSVTLEDGSPLPEWMTFDRATRTLSGSIPDYAIDVADVSRTFAIKVTAHDGDGGSVSDVFDLVVSRPVSEINGSVGNDILWGNSGSDIFYGNKGNDVLHGGGGQDVYIFNLGDGQDTIDNTWQDYWGVQERFEGTGIIEFGAGITKANLLFERSGTTYDVSRYEADLTISIAGTNDSILITDQFYHRDGEGPSITELHFANGEVMTYQEMVDTLLTPTAGDDILIGGLYGDSLIGGAGNDILYGLHGNDWMDGGTGDDTLYGSDGDDSYYFAIGYGNDVIREYIPLSGRSTASVDTLHLGTGIRPEDIILEEIDYRSLSIRIAGTNDSLYIEGQFMLKDGYSYGIESFVFSDGTVWDRRTLEAQVFSNFILNGTTGNDNILGSNFDDTITGGKGNDYLTGWHGDDVYIWHRGDGNDTINETVFDNLVDSFDVLELHYVMPEEIEIRGLQLSYHDDSDTENGEIYDVELHIGDEVIYIPYMFYYNADEVTGEFKQFVAIDEVRFDDGTVWDFAYFQNYFHGSTSGDDIITAIPGYPAVLDGGAGDDILRYATDYIFGRGYGVDTVIGSQVYYNDGVYYYADTIHFKGDLAPDDMEITRDTSGRMHIRIAGTDDVLILRDMHYNIHAQYVFENNGNEIIWDYYDLKEAYFQQNPINNEDNILIGFSDYETFNMGAGHDYVDGGEGNDSLAGGSGNDTLIGGSGSDTLNGGDGNDILDTGKGRVYGDLDVMLGGAGNDIFILREERVEVVITDFENGSDKIDLSYLRGWNGYGFGVYHSFTTQSYASAGQIRAYYDSVINRTWIVSDEGYLELSLVGNLVSQLGAEDFIFSPINVAQGGDEDDVIFGDDYNETIHGGGGNDHLYGSGGNDTLYGDAGNDSLSGDEGNDLLEGGEGNDSLEGENGNDTLRGGDGDDTLIGGAGTDSFDGGAGNDTVVFTHISGTLNVNLATGTAVAGSVTESLSNIENVIANNGNNILTGNAANNYLQGLGGNDTLYGGDGDDTLDGGVGIDRFDGGAGNDTVIFTHSSSDVDINLVAGTAVFDGGANTEYLTNIENVIATNGRNVLTGNNVANLLQSLEGDDTLNGGEGNDTLHGDGGDDVYIYHRGHGEDVIYDSHGNDTLQLTGGIQAADLTFDRIGLDLHITIAGGGAITIQQYFRIAYRAIETIVFGDGNITSQQLYALFPDETDGVITGTAGDDFLEGGSEDNQYHYTTGNDVISDAGGNDSLHLSGITSEAVTFERQDNHLLLKLQGGQILTLLHQFAADSASVIETIVFDDVSLSASDIRVLLLQQADNADASLIVGYETHDAISAGAGDDTLVGGKGDDTLSGGTGDDVYVYGIGDGNDEIIDGSASTGDVLTFNAGISIEDVAFARQGDDAVLTIAGAGNILIKNQFAEGNQGIEVIQFFDGSMLTAQDIWNAINAAPVAVADAYELNAGDTLVVAAVEGVLANDTDGDEDALSAILVNDVTHGTLVLNADGSFSYTHDGSEHLADSFSYKVNDGTVDGNTVTVSFTINPAAPSGQVIVGTAGNDSLVGSAGHDTITGLAGRDSIYGGAGNDSLDGGDGNDLIYGEDGNDTLYGGSGDNTLDGGAGDDLLIGSDVYTTTLIGGTGMDTFIGGEGHDRIWMDDEDYRVVDGNGGNDIIYGSALGDTLNGGAGADSLYGGAGNDLLDAGISNDRVFGEDGDDTLIGGGGYDTLDGGAGNDVLYGNDVNGTHLIGGTGADTFIGGNGNDRITLDDEDYRFVEGKGGNDNITGSSLSDTLYGGDGGDTLYGGAGDDLLYGEASRDAIYGEAGNDTIYGGTSYDTIDGGDGDDLIYGEDEHDTIYGGAGNDTIDGGRHNDSLYGGDGDDSLLGGEGTDVLDGGLGADTLTGGAGNDIFVFVAEADSTDVITDFVVTSQDKIDLTDSSLNAIQFNDLVMSNDNGTAVVHLGNGQTIRLAGVNHTSLTANHFIFAEPVNAVPVAVADTYGLDAGATLTVAAIDGVLANDTDGDEDALAAILVTDVAYGTLVLNADGSFSYTHDGSEHLADSFSYKVNDGTVDGNTVTVSLIITPVVTGQVLTGTSGNDTLTGGDGNDTLYGLGGDDFLYGGAGNDVLEGGDGGDQLYGEAGNDTLFGGSGNNTLDGGAGDDLLIGSDVYTTTLIGGAGMDTFIGGEGHDRIWMDDEDYRVVDGKGGHDSIYGSELEDTIYGGAGSDSLYGGGGNDSLDGGDGHDKLFGGAGNDTLYGGAGYDTLDGGEGDDVLIGNANATTMYGGDGIDTFIGGEGNDYISIDDEDYRIVEGKGGNDTIHGSSLGDTLYGFEGGDSLYGGSGHDSLDGGIHNDRLFGEDGNDTLIGSDGYDTLYGGAGDDILLGGEGSDSLYGDTGNDYLDAGIGNDRVFGEDGNDTLIGGGGYDTLDGGAGNDVLYGNDVNGTHLIGGTGADTFIGGNGGDTIILDDEDYRFVEGKGGNDNITGSSLSDTLYGGDGGDTLYGGAGDDLLYGEASRDAIYGEAGNDTIYGGTSYDTIDGGDGDDLIYGEDEHDTIYGGAGNDTIDGGRHNDSLYGGDGDDSLLGGEGNDLLDGEEGADTLTGGAGNDYLSGGDGDDVLIGESHNDTLHGGEGNDTLSGGGQNDWLYGGTGNDSLQGGAGNDWLLGGEGDDRLFGGDGNDVLISGEGNDMINGATGNDIFVFDSISGHDTITDFVINEDKMYLVGIDGAGTFADTMSKAIQSGNHVIFTFNDDLSMTVQNTTIAQFHASDFVFGEELIYGTADNDTIYGQAGHDILLGGEGNDRLDGEGGADILTGGAGNDIFVFSDLNDSGALAYDIITDFTKGQDKIDLSALGFTDIQTGAPSGSTLGFTATDGITIIEAEGSDFKIHLVGDIALNDTDFIF